MAHAEHGVTLHQQIQIDRVQAVGCAIGKAAHVSWGNGLAHPFDKGETVGGRAGMPQPAETGARQPAELWIAHAEESRPRVVLLQALADLCE